jgi:hypothetical protein
MAANQRCSKPGAAVCPGGSVHKNFQFRILQGLCILANFSLIIEMVKCYLKDLNFASKDSRSGIKVSSFGEK